MGRYIRRAETVKDRWHSIAARVQRRSVREPSAEFRTLFPPSVLFEPIIPRDAQGSLFLHHREDEPLRRLLLDNHHRVRLTLRPDTELSSRKEAAEKAEAAGKAADAGAKAEAAAK